MLPPAPGGFYDPRVLRSITRLTAAAALPIAALLSSAGPAVAVPQPFCEFAVSPPQVVDVSGNPMVTATVQPSRCDRSTAYQSVVCIQVEGGSGPGQCKRNNGILAAEVYYAPYRAGSTYVVTGRGCFLHGNPPQPECRSLSPVTATL